MLEELLHFISPLAIGAIVAFGVIWGVLLTRIVTFRLSLALGAGITGSFLLVLSAIRGIESPTPEISVARNIGALVLWGVFILAIALTGRVAQR